MNPFIVAEVAASHGGSLETALQLVDEAKQAGADAVKLQTWSKMTVSDYVIRSGPWAGVTLADLYERARTPWNWHLPIFERCRELGLVPFSTPFDDKSVDFLEFFGCPIYKIASFEITDLPLIRYAASMGKPLIISTGMATQAEIEEAVEEAMKGGAKGITLLKCVSAYPASAEGFNLITMAHMADEFGCQVGLSDHTRGSAVAIAATALGATVIEKHICLPEDDGPDSKFASTPYEFGLMVKQVREAAASIGQVSYGPSPAETDSLQFRRSVFITQDVKAGETLGLHNVGIFRPNLGILPKRVDELVGRKAPRDLVRGEPVTPELVALL